MEWAVALFYRPVHNGASATSRGTPDNWWTSVSAAENMQFIQFYEFALCHCAALIPSIIVLKSERAYYVARWWCRKKRENRMIIPYSKNARYWRNENTWKKIRIVHVRFTGQRFRITEFTLLLISIFFCALSFHCRVNFQWFISRAGFPARLRIVEFEPIEYINKTCTIQILNWLYISNNDNWKFNCLENF